MALKLRLRWSLLLSSFWFLPSLMIAAAAVLAFGLIEVDARYGAHFGDKFPRVFGTNAEGARNLLSTVASSMVSITGVTFSITIVALSLASAQYSSRILRNFMRDRATQAVLGVFLSIFLYCLIVLRSIRGGETSFVPSLSVVIGIGLGVVGVAFLIFFIHHVATSIQASSIISRIGTETLAVVDQLYPAESSDDAEALEPGSGAGDEWTGVPARETGYIQTVDYAGLAAWAELHETRVWMRRGIGDFVTAKLPLVAVASGDLPDDAEAELNSCFSVAPFRTIEQDVGFGIRQLVDISLKALSPGVNDSTTAVTCLHYLGAIFARLSRRSIPDQAIARLGTGRVVLRCQTFGHLMDEAFLQIGQNAREDVAIYLALLEALEATTHPALARTRRMTVFKQLERVLAYVSAHVPNATDQATIQRVSDRIVRALQDAGSGATSSHQTAGTAGALSAPAS